MRIILLTTTMLATMPAFAATIETPSAIAGVTVYIDGAAVQRRASMDLPAGDTIVALRGLPAGIDPASIRVEGAGSAAFSIVSVDSRLSPGDPRPFVDAELERRLEASRAERDSVAGAIEAGEGQKAAIQRYAQASPEKLGADTQPLDVERWPDAWRTIGQGLAEMNESLRVLRAKAKALGEEIAALERARPQPGRSGAPKRDILVAVQAGVPAKAYLTISYQVGSASWTPAYDARLATTGDKPRLELVRRGNIQQRTGEDWTGVAVALSTVRLRRNTAAPDLPTQSLTLVDLQAETEAMKSASNAPARPAPMARARADSRGDGQVAESEPKVAAAPVFATLDAGAYEATFTVPGVVDVPQDGTAKSFTLGMRTLEPALGARATPALDPAAYLEANFANDEDAPLLPGEVALRRDGTFVGSGRLTLAAPGEKVRLGFGADDRIRITRSPVARKDNDGGFFGGSRSETQDFRTVVKNGHAFAMRVVLVDRVPVSENTAISVTPLDTNTPPTEKIVEERRGVMGWAYDYKPGEQREIRLGWRARWPAERELRRQ